MKTAVLIPLYNHSAYIGEALASVAAQTRPAERVLIVDDGSTDGSQEAVRAFLASAPASFQARTELFPQGNAGAHVVLNRLVRLAGERGCETAAILNSDDRFHPERLARGWAELDRRPALALLGTQLRLIDADGRPLAADAERARWFAAAWAAGDGELNAATGRPDLAGWLGRANFLGTTSNFLAHTAWLRAHPFGPYRFAHDYAVLIRAALEDRLGVLDEPLLDYRVHPANTISAGPAPLVGEMLRVAADLARDLAPRLAVEPPLRAAYARWRRGAWGNVSALRADLLETIAARALATLPATDLDAILNDPALSPERDQFPNPFLAGQGFTLTTLAERTTGLAQQLEAARADIRARAELRRIQNLLLGSRWFALGRLLNRVRPLHQAGGKGAEEKLSRLQQRVRDSPWLALGRRVGSRSAEAIVLRSKTHEPRPGRSG